MDLIRAIAKEMGYKKCTIRNMGFDALIPAINAGNLDVSIAGFSITEERKQQVIFSQPYYKSGLAFVVRKEVNDVKKFEDLKGKIIAGAMYAEKLKSKGAVVKTFNTSDLACMELKNKGADAVVSDLPVLQYFLKNGGSEYAKLAGEPLTAEDYGIVISKKKPELAKEVDKALDTLKKNGTYDKLYEKWFGMVVMMAAGCGGGEKKKAEAPKVLRVGTEPTFAPFEFQKDGSKEFDGFDMDLIRAIGKQLNMKVEILNMGFDALIPALNAGNIDVAAAGMSITPDRQKAVDMSDPYYVAGLVVVVNKDNTAVKGINELNNKGIAVQIGTTGAERAAKVPGAKVKNFNTNAEVFLELKNKGVEAVIIDKPVAEYFLATGGGKDYAKIVGDTMEAESYGLSLKKNSPLTKDINKALLDLKKNGEYDKIYAKWFGAVKK